MRRRELALREVAFLLTDVVAAGIAQRVVIHKVRVASSVRALLAVVAASSRVALVRFRRCLLVLVRAASLMISCLLFLLLILSLFLGHRPLLVRILELTARLLLREGVSLCSGLFPLGVAVGFFLWRGHFMLIILYRDFLGKLAW